MPPILSRYVLRETAQTWFVVTLVLLLILVTYQFAQVLSDAAGARVPKEAIFRVLGLTSVQFLAILTPVGLFLSILLALGRLYRDSEMAAFMACGVGPAGLYRPLGLIAAVLALFVGWLALEVSPTATREIRAVAEEARQQADLSMLEAGQFFPFGGIDAVIYAETVAEDGSLGNVFVQRRDGDAVEVIVAQRAWQSPAAVPGYRLLRFANGHRYKGVPGSPRFDEVTFREHGIPFAIPEAEAPEQSPESLRLRELLNAQTPVERAELQWRLSAPLNLLVLVLLAVPLSRSSPRQGRYSGVFMGVLLYVIYVNLLAASQVWLQRGEISPLLGLWWVHGLFALLALLMLARQYGLFTRWRRQLGRLVRP